MQLPIFSDDQAKIFLALAQQVATLDGQMAMTDSGQQTLQAWCSHLLPPGAAPASTVPNDYAACFTTADVTEQVIILLGILPLMETKPNAQKAKLVIGIAKALNRNDLIPILDIIIDFANHHLKKGQRKLANRALKTLYSISFLRLIWLVTLNKLGFGKDKKLIEKCHALECSTP